MTPRPYRPRNLHMRMADGEELRQQVARLSRRRQAHGYRRVQELQGTAMAGAAA